MPEPCKEHMCATCAKNFDKLVEGIFRHLYPKVSVLKDTFDRYSMRNDSKKLIKIIQKFLSLFDLITNRVNLLVVFPNKYLDYEIRHLEDRISGAEGFNFDDSLLEGEVLVKFQTILRATLCENCYQKWRHNTNFLNDLYRLYFRCTCVKSLFNYLVKGTHLLPILDKDAVRGRPKLSDVIKDKLIEFQTKSQQFIHPDWRGSDYYFRKLFGVPIFLSGIIPREHFESLHCRYFNDVIAGHPMASNGWMREAMDEMEDDGVF